MSSQFDYYYGDEAEQFAFYRIPKLLITSPVFKRLSDGAKLLYGLMLDRMCLSVKNGWVDEHNRAYIFFTTNDVMDFFDYLQENCRQYLMDIDTPEFRGNLVSFMQRKADFEDYNDKTAKALKKYAGVEPDKSPKKKEPER